MKKGWKIFWIVCGSLAGVGLVLTIVGFALGGSFMGTNVAMWKYEHRMEQKEERMDGQREDLWEDDLYDEDLDEEEIFHENDLKDGQNTGNVITVDASTVSEMEVEVPSLEVKVLPGEEDGKIIVRKEGLSKEMKEALMVVQDATEGELKIFVKDRNACVDRQDCKGTLEILLPKDGVVLPSMQLDVDAGILELKDVQVGELDVNVGAGTAELIGFVADQMEANVGTGRLTIDGTVKLESSIECGIGEIDFRLPGNKEDYRYDIECGAGTVTLGGETLHGIGGEKKVGSAGPLVEIECGAGTVNVEFAK